jgi:ABC-2 type transport system permease protein
MGHCPATTGDRMKGRSHSFLAEVRLLTHLPGAWALAFLLLGLTAIAVMSGLLRQGADSQTLEPLRIEEQQLRETLVSALQRYESATDLTAAMPLAGQAGALGFSVLHSYAELDRPPLAPLASGVSQLLPDYYRFDAHSAFLQRSTANIDNPLRLSAGSFDLAFVLVFLVPIIVIALSYDVMSREKELGVLALAGAQGVSIRRFISMKMLARGSVIVLAIVAMNLLAVCLVALLADVPDITSVIAWTIVSVLYGLVWFGLAALTNAAGMTSATNGVVLANLWLLLVIVVPAVVNLVATNVYPAPSRVELTTELREASSEAEEKAVEAREQYFFDHPDLAAENADPEVFFRDVARSEGEIARSIQPQLAAFDEQAKSQAEIVSWLKYFSPALLADQAFAAMAGTDREYYARFKSAAFTYHGGWRDYFVRKLDAGIGMTTEDWAELPEFSWSPPTVVDRLQKVLASVAVLGAMVLLLLAAALANFRRYSPV